MYKRPAVPEIFVVMLRAELMGPMRPVGTLKSRDKLPFINDFSPRWQTLTDVTQQLPKLWLAPQTIITAKGESDAEDKADFLLMKECPRHRGWSNHWRMVTNISPILQEYFSMRPSGEQPLSMYLINCVGLLYDENGLLRQYSFSTASSGVDEYDAYDYFKEVLLDEPSFAKSYWIGGTAYVTKIPEKQLRYWKDTWAAMYQLHQWAPEAHAMAH